MSTEKPDTGAAETDVLTVEELAKMLRISRASAYRAVGSGQVPGTVRINGKTLRVSRRAVVAWLAQGSVSPDDGVKRR